MSFVMMRDLKIMLRAVGFRFPSIVDRRQTLPTPKLLVIPYLAEDGMDAEIC